MEHQEIIDYLFSKQKQLNKFDIHINYTRKMMKDHANDSSLVEYKKDGIEASDKIKKLKEEVFQFIWDNIHHLSFQTITDIKDLLITAIQDQRRSELPTEKADELFHCPIADILEYLCFKK